MFRRLCMLAALSGCSGPSGSDMSILDLRGVPHDFAVGDHDLAVADLSVDDMALPPDMAHPVCDLAGVEEDAGQGLRLWLAAPGASGELLSASFRPSSGWTSWTTDASVTITDVATTLYGEHPLVAVRRNDARLQVAVYEPCVDGLGALGDPFASPFTSNLPGLGGGELVFKGGISNDQRLYYASFDGSSWASPTEQSSFLSPRGPSVTRAGGATHAVFVGTDTTVYDGVVSTAAGGGNATATAGTTAQTPAAVTLDDGTVFIVFTGMDTNLYWTAADGLGGFTAPKALCAGLASCLDTSDAGPAVAPVTGGAVVAWHGTDSNIYAASLLRNATLANSTFSATTNVSATETSAFPPTVSAGLFDAQAELVYIRGSDGAARHARLSTTWSAPATIPGATAAGAPSLASR